MQISEDFQFDQSFCMEWLKYFFARVSRTLLQLLESTGPTNLSNAILSYVRDIQDE